MESMIWLNSSSHMWCPCPEHFLSLPNTQSGRERDCESPESWWRWPARGVSASTTSMGPQQRHWIVQRPGDWQFPLLYELFRRDSKVCLFPNSIIWWEFFKSFLLPQGFDINQGSAGSCGLLIQKMFATSSVVRKLHSDMRSFSANVNRDCFIWQSYLCMCTARILLWRSAGSSDKLHLDCTCWFYQYCKQVLV